MFETERRYITGLPCLITTATLDLIDLITRVKIRSDIGSVDSNY